MRHNQKEAEPTWSADSVPLSAQQSHFCTMPFTLIRSSAAYAQRPGPTIDEWIIYVWFGLGFLGRWAGMARRSAKSPVTFARGFLPASTCSSNTARKNKGEYCIRFLSIFVLGSYRLASIAVNPKPTPESPAEVGFVVTPSVMVWWDER